jgi:hypothetical protein
MTGFKCASRMAAPERPPHRNEPPSPNSLSWLALHGHHAHLFVTFCKIVWSFVPSSLENRLPGDKSEETVLTKAGLAGIYRNRGICLRPASFSNRATILRQSRWLYGCGPLEGAGSRPNSPKAVHVLVDCFFKSEGVNHTPENVQLFLPHRQNRWLSQRIRRLLGSGSLPLEPDPQASQY